MLLWWLTKDRLLSSSALAAIQAPENTIFVSAVTLWEIRLKQSLGKLRLPPDFESKLEAEGFEDLPLTAAHTRHVASLEWHHRDPFDRMLIAQARAEGIEVLTADSALAAYGGAVRLAG